MRFEQCANEFVGLEPLLGERVTALSYEAIRRIAEVHHTPETDRIDFKRSIEEGSSGRDDVAKSLARDVAAMANHLGGLIFIGIDERTAAGEKTHAAQRLTPINRVFRDRPVEDWFLATVAQLVVPWITIAVEWIPDPDDEQQGILLVGIPRGEAEPYAVDLRDGKFQYQRRRGTDNTPLTESEIARAFANVTTREPSPENAMTALAEMPH